MRCNKISKIHSSFVNDIRNRDINGVEILCGKQSNFFGRLIGIQNEYIDISINKKTITLENKKIFSLVDNAISTTRKTVGDKWDSEKWLKDEAVTLQSSVVNKAIDTVCEKHSFKLNKNEKAFVFNKLSTRQGVKLDSNCAQSNISQILHNNSYLTKKIESLYHKGQTRDEKNKLKNIVNSELTNLIFTKKFKNYDLKALKENAAEVITDLIKLNKHIADKVKNLG